MNYTFTGPNRLERIEMSLQMLIEKFDRLEASQASLDEAVDGLERTVAATERYLEDVAGVVGEIQE